MALFVLFLLLFSFSSTEPSSSVDAMVRTGDRVGKSETLRKRDWEQQGHVSTTPLSRDYCFRSAWWQVPKESPTVDESFNQTFDP